jgi:hypothetical protein
VIQIVEPMPTSISVTTTQNPVHFNDPVSFTANVTWYNSIIGNTPLTDGTVTFNEGTTTLGTSTLNSSGYATFTTSSLAVGSHSITAEYNGGDGWATSTTGSLTQTVIPMVTTTTVVSTATPSVYGQPVNFTATVFSNFGTPAGTVQFFSDGAPFGSTISLLPNGNATSVNKADIPVSGSPHNITAVFSSTNPNYAGSQGKVYQTVNKASTTTALTSSSVLAGAGVAITFTAAVTPMRPGAGTPTGIVTFKDGTITLGTGTLAGVGGAIFTTSTLAVGNHQIIASYGGDANFNPSLSNNPLAITITRAPVITAFVPGLGAHGTTINIAILGNYFQNGVTANLQQGSTTIPVTIKTVTLPSRIAGSVSIPASARGKWNIVITNIDGGQGTGINAMSVS